MKKTILSLLTIGALNIHLHAEEIILIDNNGNETYSTLEDDNSALPIAEPTIITENILTTEPTVMDTTIDTNINKKELIHTTSNDTVSNATMSMIDTDGKSYNIQANKNSFKIEGMEGKVVFLEFFGLNCPACKQLMPTLINLQEKYKDKLQVMSIEVQKHDNDPINAYKKEHNINYITLSNFDVGSVVRYIADKSGWTGAIPFLVAIDSKGEVQFTQAGVLAEEELEKQIKKFSK